MPKWRNWDRKVYVKPFKYPREGEPGYRHRDIPIGNYSRVYYRAIGPELEYQISRMARGAGCEVAGSTYITSGREAEYADGRANTRSFVYSVTPFTD